ncbi:MAG TPA: hypothetical protein VMW29_00665, partial [Candidatus Bathyarchaeia archaeon]|nr:hypothetical protein [Candidatus Bathyarchaeia archaeon]
PKCVDDATTDCLAVIAKYQPAVLKPMLMDGFRAYLNPRASAGFSPEAIQFGRVLTDMSAHLHQVVLNEMPPERLALREQQADKIAIFGLIQAQTGEEMPTPDFEPAPIFIEPEAKKAEPVKLTAADLDNIMFDVGTRLKIPSSLNLTGFSATEMEQIITRVRRDFEAETPIVEIDLDKLLSVRQEDQQIAELFRIVSEITGVEVTYGGELEGALAQKKFVAIIRNVSRCLARNRVITNDMNGFLRILFVKCPTLCFGPLEDVKNQAKGRNSECHNVFASMSRERFFG